MAAVVDEAEQAKTAGADLVEVWLGEIEDLDVKALIQQIAHPVLVNCKGAEEKGAFTGTAEEKTALLIASAQAGAAFVDIDHEFDAKLLEQLHKNKRSAKLIFSAHFFDGTPGLPHLTAKLPKMLEHKPDMVKFAAMPNAFKDVVTMIRLAEKLTSKQIPHITISMGELGKITRVAAPVLGSEIMFATVDETKASAPGQISAKELANVYKLW